MVRSCFCHLLFISRFSSSVNCVVLRRCGTDGNVELYDTDREVYVGHRLRDNLPIPLFGITIVRKFMAVARKCGPITIKKTNMPPSGVSISPDPTPEHTYRNIKTCLLRDVDPTVIVNYSDSELAFAGVPKLVMAHKMYGFPYLDEMGEFGISNRDNYVIAGRDLADLRRLKGRHLVTGGAA